MTTKESYVVYELVSVMGNSDYLALREVTFTDWKSKNPFDSEEEAIQALINDNKKYEDYVILKQVYLEP